LPPHPFVLSYNNTGRGPDATSLPFANSGYAINNHLNSFALELNSRSRGFANRFFASYNRFRDFREPFSKPFPTIEIGDGGVTYTTVGHEPFSIHNILDQDVWQLTDNFSWFRGKHVVTLGANFEKFSFFNSFNIFRYGVFFLAPPDSFGHFGGSTFSSLDQFFLRTNPGPNYQGKDSTFIDFSAPPYAASGLYKGEDISVGQLGFYLQDEYPVTDRLNLTYGLRVDFPMYFTNPVDNPFSRSLTALDANGNPEIVDQSKLPNAAALWSPRLGFNWNASGDRRTQVRGGTGIFTGRVPFVWIGNVLSNPGLNPDGGAGIYVLDNTSDGHSVNVTAQLRKNFASGLSTSIGYSFTDARNNLKSTEIASVLWQNEPVKGDPNKPELSYSEFGPRH